jgi:ABC-type uncharacterized transport system ATPase subunit
MTKREGSIPLISMRKVQKTFGGVRANDGIDLDIYGGEVHAILGENGAGKTTLMNILSGIYRADSGGFLMRGSPVSIKSPKDAIRLGIVMVHQHFRLIGPHTVAENVVLGLSTSFFSPLKGIERTIEEYSARYNLLVHPRARICDLSVGEQQRVEIVKALIRGAEVLILDEPTSVLTPQETKELFCILERMKEERKAVIFITHKLEEVLEVADRITILRRGTITASMPAAGVKKAGKKAKEELAKKMVGREVLLSVDKRPVAKSLPVLEIRDLRVEDDRGRETVKGLSFDVCRGEVFGIVGVAGNGQNQLVEALFGLRPAKSGTVAVHGDVGYIPEDRMGMGSVGELTLSENCILTQYKNSCFGGGVLFDLSYIREYTQALVAKFAVSAPSISTPAKQLSGGNLQRLILARELSRNTSLLIAEQPTHGLDVGSIEYVWRFLLEQRRNAGILLVSGDLGEVIALSDRIGVLYKGTLTLFEQPFEDKEEQIGLKMTGL